MQRKKKSIDYSHESMKSYIENLESQEKNLRYKFQEKKPSLTIKKVFLKNLDKPPLDLNLYKIY